MTGNWGISKISRMRIIRVLAIFFLFYTAADLLVPQVCTEDLGGLHSEALVSVPAHNVGNNSQPTSIGIQQSDSQKEEPNQQSTSYDEDCFCCCAHILPVSHFTPREGGELVEIWPESDPEGLPSSPPHKAYRPPRLA
jgi:hypothetical protein